MITYEIPCLLGLEKLVADEIKRLGLADVRAENGRVLCQGSWADCARLNINLRCGARVIALLGQFPARSFEELFQGVRAIPWEEFLPREAAFPVKGYSISSQLHSVPACQSIIKKAVVERLKAHYGMDQFPETGTKYQIRFSVFKDQVSIGLDASGEGLYKRGYRAVGVEAPLRETLAAALVTLSRYRAATRSAIPSAAAAPSPLRRRSSPRTAPPVWTGALTPRSGHFCRLRAGWTRRTRPRTGSSTGSTISGAATSTPAPWTLPGTTPARPAWTTASALRWPTQPNSTGTAPMASW